MCLPRFSPRIPPYARLSTGTTVCSTRQNSVIEDATSGKLQNQPHPATSIGQVIAFSYMSSTPAGHLVHNSLPPDLCYNLDTPPDDLCLSRPNAMNHFRGGGSFGNGIENADSVEYSGLPI